jgi:toxin-antitoxin system PIN domain toxin
MTSLVFPDINVWLAIAVSGHIHHHSAKHWYQQIGTEEIVFCRFTQLGLLRLLTTSAVMGPDVLNQRQAWSIYDQFTGGGAKLLPDPQKIEASMRALTRQAVASPKLWADAYLAAFAHESAATLITFDKALASMADAVLLK